MYLSSRKDKIITNIESSNKDFKFLKCFKKSIGRESYYYLLTLHSNRIYIYDSTTNQQLRKLKLNAHVSDLIINDTLNMMVIHTYGKITAFQFDDILDFTNYNR